MSLREGALSVSRFQRRISGFRPDFTSSEREFSLDFSAPRNFWTGIPDFGSTLADLGSRFQDFQGSFEVFRARFPGFWTRFQDFGPDFWIHRISERDLRISGQFCRISGASFRIWRRDLKNQTWLGHLLPQRRAPGRSIHHRREYTCTRHSVADTPAYALCEYQTFRRSNAV
eukprot:3663718-Rhodomonas_salina.1